MGPRLGTIILPPGFGKTRVGLAIIKEFKKALVIVPTTNLKNQWKRIIEENGLLVRVECTKAAIKIDEEFDLVVYDEIHMMLSPIYKKVLDIKGAKLGLTGTPPINNGELLDEKCPIIYERTVEDALKVEAIAEFKVENIGVKMTPKDAYKYRLFDKNFKEAAIILNKQKYALKRPESVFDLAKIYSKSDEKSALVKAAKQYWSAMTMRKWICYENEAKIAEVVKQIKKYPDKKWMLFNKSIKFAEKLQAVLPGSFIYHSKLKDKDKEEMLSTYATSKNGIMIAVDALNAGLDIPDADAAIEISYTSVPLTYQQRRARVTRKVGDKIALLINLYTIGTVEERWLESKNG